MGKKKQNGVSTEKIVLIYTSLTGTTAMLKFIPRWLEPLRLGSLNFTDLLKQGLHDQKNYANLE